MTRRRIVLVAIALVVGGWMLFDGVHALVSGDFVTAASGDGAGRLGPWASLLEAVGIPPRSIGVKLLHVACGALWLLGALAAVRNGQAMRRLLIIAAVASLWYLPFGTLAGAITLGLAWRPAAQATAGPARAV